jgi:hypothetical protein
MYQEQKHARAEFAELKERVGQWKCPNSQCKEHTERMDAQDREIDEVRDCVMTLKDHEKIVIGAAVLAVTAVGAFLIETILRG